MLSNAAIIAAHSTMAAVAAAAIVAAPAVSSQNHFNYEALDVNQFPTMEQFNLVADAARNGCFHLSAGDENVLTAAAIINQLSPQEPTYVNL